MTTLVDFHASVVRGLSEDQRLRDLRAAVTAHGGDFTLEDLKRYAKQSPAVIVSVLSVATQDQAAVHIARVCVGVVCLATKGRAAGVSPHDQVLALADATLRALRGRFWSDLLSMAAPEELKGRNMYGAKLDTLGAAMWGLSFEQDVDLVDTDPSVPLSWVHLDWDVAPANGVIDAQDDIDTR